MSSPHTDAHYQDGDPPILCTWGNPDSQRNCPYSLACAVCELDYPPEEAGPACGGWR